MNYLVAYKITFFNEDEIACTLIIDVENNENKRNC